ncbi:MAG: DivIVA domain-containing protein [Actinomycetota bacterium]|nr:DivIVA domain-containing protein [Actinomycetota bacterium]
MLDFLLLVVGVLVVGGLLFLGASLLMGRGETQLPADPGRSPVELPDDRLVLGDDVRALRLSPAFRGYRMSEVDWLIDEFASILDERDAELAALRGSGAAHPPGAGATKQDGAPAPGDSAERAHDRNPDEERPRA